MKSFLGAAFIVASGIQAVFPATVYQFGPLPNTLTIFVRAITPDGRTAVGSSTDISLASKAFRWTENGLQDLGHLGSFWAEAVDVSDDGRFIVGTSSPTSRNAPILALWTDLQIRGVDLGQQTKGLGISGDGLRVLVMYASPVRPILWSSTSGKMELKSSLTPAYQVPSVAVLSKNGATVFGNPFYFVSDEEAYGSRAGRWTDATGWEQLSQIDGTPIAVSRDGSRTLFKFETSPRVYYVWTRETGLVETSIPNYIPAFMSSDGQWIFLSQPAFLPDGSAALGVWHGDGTFAGKLKDWIGNDPIPSFSWSEFRLTAVSGSSPYHLAGYVGDPDLIRSRSSILIRDITPWNGFVPLKEFRIGVELSGDLTNWTAITNVTVLCPADMTNRFFRLKLFP